MPDKTTPQIEKAARIIDPEAFGLPNTFHQPDEDGFVLSDRDEARAKAEAILSTTLEPSEAEIRAAARAMCTDRVPDNGDGGPHPSGIWLDEGEAWWTGYVDQARDGLIAAARVRELIWK